MWFPDALYVKRTFDLAKSKTLNAKLIPYVTQKRFRRFGAKMGTGIQLPMMKWSN